MQPSQHFGNTVGPIRCSVVLFAMRLRHSIIQNTAHTSKFAAPDFHNGGAQSEAEPHGSLRITANRLPTFSRSTSACAVNIVLCGSMHIGATPRHKPSP